jgi:DTW domain-containing protein YfiP
LQNIYIFQGVDFSPGRFSKLDSLLNENGYENIVLFPEENKSKNGNESKLFGSKNKKLNLISIDGTWAHAKYIFKWNEWLHNLKRIKLDVKDVALYNELKKEPRDSLFRVKCLSTAESVGFALNMLGFCSCDSFNLNILDTIRIPIKLLIEHQKRNEFCVYSNY